jgi:hypothetical protein
MTTLNRFFIPIATLLPLLKLSSLTPFAQVYDESSFTLFMRLPLLVVL